MKTQEGEMQLTVSETLESCTNENFDTCVSCPLWDNCIRKDTLNRRFTASEKISCISFVGIAFVIALVFFLSIVNYLAKFIF